MTGASSLTLPHHDGSLLFVPDQAPNLGDRVVVRVRVPHAHVVDEVHVRQVVDGEPTFRAARRAERTDAEQWWEAEIECHNQVTNYRFLLRGGDLGYQWLNGTGIHERDVPDAADFRLVTYPAPPAWALDAVVYQVFPDRFARGTSSPPVAQVAPDWAHPAQWDDPVDLHRRTGGQQLYGGDLDGIREHLDHLERLGVDALYLTPFFPARSNHRYDAASFDRVDPVLGGDDALDRLLAEAHRRGLKVLGDLTTNHTGVTHEWFVAAEADPAAPQRNYYFFDESGDYAKWLDVPSLPKLDHSSPGLRAAMFDDADAPVRRWLTGAEALDGWRVDVANMTGRYRAQDVNHAVARHMRETMTEVAPDALLVGEHCHDHSLDAMGDGWHGVMNYSGFTRPLWTWLRDKGFAPNFLGSPLMVPRLGGASVAETMVEFGAIVPWRSKQFSFNLTGSHDTTRVRTLVGDDERQVLVAAALLLTMPGIPLITYGDEIGMVGEFGEDGRKPMPWDESRWDHSILEGYRDLIALRREWHPLRHGGLRWVSADDDVLTYVRESPEGGVLVSVARAGSHEVRVPAALLGASDGSALTGGASHDGEDVVLRTEGPSYAMWGWKASRG